MYFSVFTHSGLGSAPGSDGTEASRQNEEISESEVTPRTERIIDASRPVLARGCVDCSTNPVIYNAVQHPMSLKSEVVR